MLPRVSHARETQNACGITSQRLVSLRCYMCVCEHVGVEDAQWKMHPQMEKCICKCKQIPVTVI